MKNRLFKNIGFLSISQAANYVLPLVVIPYITRVVGPGRYGMIEFATVAMLYFIVLANFGFTTTATRKIAQADQNWNKISFVFSSVQSTKLLLFIVSLIIFTGMIFIVPKFNENSLLMISAFPIILGWVFYPDYLFQGLQQLQVVALANFFVKLLAAILIFTLLKRPEDFYYVLGINSLAQILVGVFTNIYAYRIFPKLKYKWPGWQSILASLAISRFVFFSQLFSRIYSFGSITILGFLLLDYELGIYSASMKLIVVSISFLFLPLHGALFPFMAKMYKENKQDYLKSFKKTMAVFMLISGVSSLILFLIPEIFIKIVFGLDYLQAIPFVKIMAPIIFLNSITHFALNQGLLVMKKDVLYLIIVIIGAALTVSLNLLIVPNYGVEGASYAKLIVELTIAVLSISFFIRALKKNQLLMPK